MDIKKAQSVMLLRKITLYGVPFSSQEDFLFGSTFRLCSYSFSYGLICQMTPRKVKNMTEFSRNKT